MSNRWRVLVISATAAGALVIGWKLAASRSFIAKRQDAFRGDERASSRHSGSRSSEARRKRTPADEIEGMDTDAQEQMLRELSGLL